jgi:hypothetical protein
MTLFARCFLLVFCQLGVGGLASLAVPPFHELERGFYKSSAGVYWSASLIGGCGTVYLWLTRASSGIGILEMTLWVLHAGLFGLYLSTLWGDAAMARARLFAASLLSGFGALSASAFTLVAAEGGLVGLLSIVSTLVSAVTLGAVTTGMLIGHWYLIDPGMEIEPFRRCFRFFVGALWVEIGVIVATLGLMLLRDASVEIATHLELLALRIALGPIAALAISAMIRRVLAIPQTMAATGLFYIATLAVLVGEFLGRYFTFRTGLPL